MSCLLQYNSNFFITTTTITIEIGHDGTTVGSGRTVRGSMGQGDQHIQMTYGIGGPVQYGGVRGGDLDRILDNVGLIFVIFGIQIIHLLGQLT